MQNEEQKFTRERPMTVEALIEALLQFPTGTRVMVPGYEGGFHDCGAPRLERIALNRNPDDRWDLGPHTEAGENDQRGVISAIVLSDANKET